MLKPLLPCSTSTILEQIDIHTPSISSKLSKGSLPQNSVSSKTRSQISSNVITLASVNSQQQLQVNAEALQLLNSYSKWELSFCGIIGLSSKSHPLVGQLLQIPVLTDSSINKQLPNNKIKVNMTKIPEVLTTASKLFFIEYRREQSQLPKQKQLELKIIQLIISVANSLVLYTDDNYDLIEIQDMLNKSSRKLGIEIKSELWPKNAYVLNLETGNDRVRMISSIFRRTLPFSRYQSGLQLRRDIVADLTCNSSQKQYKNMKINSSVTCQILLKLIQPHSLNLIKILSSIMTQLYQESHSCLTALYDTIAQNQLKNEQPYLMDQLLDMLGEVRRAVEDKYQLNLCQELTQFYWQKLDDYIEQKERMILEVNRKKNKNRIKASLQDISISKDDVLTNEGLSSLMQQVKQKLSLYDQGGEEIVPRFLLKVVRYHEKGIRKLKEGQTTPSQTIVTPDEINLMQTIGQRRYQLEALKQKNASLIEKSKAKEKKYERLKLKRKQVKENLSSLRKQLQLATLAREEVGFSKMQIKRQQDELLGLIRDLEEKQRENDYILRGVESELDFDPAIDRMERRLSTLISQCERLEEKKQIMNSFIQAESNIHNITFNQE